MLTEMRPLLCPFASSFADQLKVAELFLPTMFEHEADQKRYVGEWSGEFIQLFVRLYNAHSTRVPLMNNADRSLVQLLSRVAYDAVGCIDWQPYLDTIFTRTLRAFNLPAGKYGHKPVIYTPPALFSPAYLAYYQSLIPYPLFLIH
jgi:proteasome activator subunit 4